MPRPPRNRARYRPIVRRRPPRLPRMRRVAPVPRQRRNSFNSAVVWVACWYTVVKMTEPSVGWRIGESPGRGSGAVQQPGVQWVCHVVVKSLTVAGVVRSSSGSIDRRTRRSIVVSRLSQSLTAREYGEVRDRFAINCSLVSKWIQSAPRVASAQSRRAHNRHWVRLCRKSGLGGAGRQCRFVGQAVG